MKKKTAVVFDLDGTLLDTLEDLRDAVNYTMRASNYPERSLDEIRRFVGNGAKNLINRVLPEYADEKERGECLKIFYDYYREHAAIKTAPYKGVIELLEFLRDRDIPVAVVSNKPDVAVRSLCQRYFGDLVPCAIGDREGWARKPAPDSVLFTIKECGCESAIYVGDSETDVLTAKNADIPCVSVTWGFRDRELLEEHGADHIVTDCEALKSTLIRLLDIDL